MVECLMPTAQQAPDLSMEIDVKTIERSAPQ